MANFKAFDPAFTTFDSLPKPNPDFNNLVKILKKEKADRPTLFEFIINPGVIADVLRDDEKSDDVLRNYCNAWAKLGYDFIKTGAMPYGFPRKAAYERQNTLSLNDTATIEDWESFEAYNWLDPAKCYDGHLERAEAVLPEGMKMIVDGPMGVLENVIGLVGYDNLCYMMVDEPELVDAIFDKVGSGLYEYYRIAMQNESVGAVLLNDDWGFNQQTMLTVEQMRKYVFPWHKKIVADAHRLGKYAILHSCGNLVQVIDDITDDICFDGKHSYEDKIMPVEQAYDLYHERFAVLGGIDIDFMTRKTPEEIYNRAVALLEKTGNVAYALGTGNSVPDYIPRENYLALQNAVIQNR